MRIVTKYRQAFSTARTRQSLSSSVRWSACQAPRFLMQIIRWYLHADHTLIQHQQRKLQAAASSATALPSTMPRHTLPHQAVEFTAAPGCQSLRRKLRTQQPGCWGSGDSLCCCPGPHMSAAALDGPCMEAHSDGESRCGHPDAWWCDASLVSRAHDELALLASADDARHKPSWKTERSRESNYCL
jgi:hypothetical protein